MGYLQLADNGSQNYYQHLMDVDPRELYVFVPTDMEGGGRWVREDLFDNMPDWQYEQVMDALEPFQDVGVNGWFSRMKEKRAERRERKQARKDLKAQSKATARIQRTEGGGVLSKITDTVKGIFGQTPVDAGFEIRSGQDPTGYIQADTQPFYTKPLFLGAVGIVVIGTVIYFVRKSNK